MRYTHQNNCKLLKHTNDYYKYSEKARSGDIGFQPNNYNTFQFGEIKYHKINCDSIIQSLEIWSQQCFSIPLNYKIITSDKNHYINNMYNTTLPKDTIENTTHLLLLFPKEDSVVILLDHYYCDGHVLFASLEALLDFKQHIPLPKYKYYPIISDLMLATYFTKQIYLNIRYPTQLKLGSETMVYSKEMKKNNYSIWNRWTIYAEGITQIFDGCDHVNYLKIGLTVGIDTDQFYTNNRIGCIIVVIQRPKNYNTESKEVNFKNIADQFKKQSMANYRDGMLSYDLLRSYNTTYLRTYFSTNHIDIIFTTFKVANNFPNILSSTTSLFGGNLCYIGGATYKDRCMLTIQIGADKWNDDKLLNESNYRKKYTFQH